MLIKLTDCGKINFRYLELWVDPASITSLRVEQPDPKIPPFTRVFMVSSVSYMVTETPEEIMNRCEV